MHLILRVEQHGEMRVFFPLLFSHTQAQAWEEAAARRAAHPGAEIRAVPVPHMRVPEQQKG